MEPNHTISKMLGYAPHTQKRSTKKWTISGLFYTTSLIITRCFLICVSVNPSKFTKATNSDIINYGIWIQTEVSMVISLWFLIRALTKINTKWTIAEKFVEIDEILHKEFYVNLHYKDFKFYGLTAVCTGAITAFILFTLTIYFLIDIPFDPFHKACVCFSIYMSNVCILAITSEFICYTCYIFMRFHWINIILRQLIFDDSYLHHTIVDESLSKELTYTNYIPVDHKKCFLSTRPKVSSIRMSEWMEHRKNEHAIHEKLPTKLRFITPLAAFMKIFVSKATFHKSSSPPYVLDKLTLLISLHEKLTECVTLMNILFSTEMFFILMLIFTYLLFGLFSRYMLIVDYKTGAYNISSLNLTWMQAYSLSALSIIASSSVITKRAKQTAVIVHRVIRKANDLEIQNKLLRFSKILYSRRVTLSFGLIEFDWPFLFQLSGAVAAYLIILIQFQMSNKKDSN